MRVIVWGSEGHMGRLVIDELQRKGHEVVGTVDRLHRRIEPADVIIDFSSPASLSDLLEYALSSSTPVVIATTGHTEEQEELINQASASIPVLQSANMSVGMNLLFHLVEEVAGAFLDSDIEVVETHHRRKKDAPSGSARTLVESIERAVGNRHKVYGREGTAPRHEGEIGVHAVRGGNIVGQHDVHFFGFDETITLTHIAHDRKIFASGAVRAAEFLLGRPAGKYSMRDCLELGKGAFELAGAP